MDSGTPSPPSQHGKGPLTHSSQSPGWNGTATRERRVARGARRVRQPGTANGQLGNAGPPPRRGAVKAHSRTPSQPPDWNGRPGHESPWRTPGPPPRPGETATHARRANRLAGTAGPPGDASRRGARRVRQPGTASGQLGDIARATQHDEGPAYAHPANRLAEQTGRPGPPKSSTAHRVRHTGTASGQFGTGPPPQYGKSPPRTQRQPLGWNRPGRPGTPSHPAARAAIQARAVAHSGPAIPAALTYTESPLEAVVLTTGRRGRQARWLLGHSVGFGQGLAASHVR